MRFAKALPKQERLSAVRQARNERSIWQRRFWEHLIRNDADSARHIEYCYINPVKHGLVTRVRDWPHSSFHRDVRRSVLQSIGPASSARLCRKDGGLRFANPPYGLSNHTVSA